MSTVGFKLGDIHPAQSPVLEEAKNPRAQEIGALLKVGSDVAQIPKSRRWASQPVFRARDKQWINRLNPVFKHSFRTILQTPQLIPQVFYSALPRTETSDNVRNALMKPSDLRTFLRAMRDALQEGNPPYSVSVFLTSPKQAELAHYVSGVANVMKKFGIGGGGLKPEDAAKAKAGLKMMRTSRLGRQSFIWERRTFEITLRRQQLSGDKGTRVFLDISEDAVPDRGAGYRGVTPQRATSNMDARLRKLNLASLNPQDVGEMFTDVWFAHSMYASNVFYQYLKMQTQRMFRTIERPETPPNPDKKPFDAPHASKPVDPVEPSHYGSGPEVSMIVTADPSERVYQRADGSYTRPNQPKLERMSKAMPPANFFTPLVSEDGRFKAQLGLTYDSPLLGQLGQTWWYKDIALLVKAAERYAKFTGDKPHFSARVIDTFTHKIRVSRELQSGGDPGLRDIRQSLRGVQQQLKTAIRAGHDQHYAYLKAQDMPELAAYWKEHRTPSAILSNADGAPRVEKDRMQAFVRGVRSDSRAGLGIFSQGKSSTDGSAANVFQKLRQDQEAGQDRRRRVQRRWAGEKNEPWTLFFVEYLVAYGQTQQPRANSILIPISVYSKVIPDDKGRSRIDKITEDWLLEQAQKAWPQLKMFRTKRKHEWDFHAANLRQPLPYARVVRKGIRLNQAAVDLENAQKYKDTPVTRTKWGYKIEGDQYESGYMVVAMPGSVGHAERAAHGLALTHKGETYRAMLDSTRQISQAIKREGLTPYPQSVVSLDPTSYEVKGEVLRRIQPSIGKGPYTGKTEYRGIRPGHFRVRLGNRLKGQSDADGDIYRVTRFGKRSVTGMVQRAKRLGTEAAVKNALRGLKRYKIGKINHKEGKYSLTFRKQFPYKLPILADYTVGSGIPRANPKERKFVSPNDPRIQRHDVTILSRARDQRRVHRDVTRTVRRIGSQITRVVYDYERTEKPKKRHKLYKALMKPGGFMHRFREEVHDMLQDVVKDHVRITYESNDAAAQRTTAQYIDYVDKERTIPRVVTKRMGNIQWDAPVAVTGHSTVSLSVPAPSEDIARLVLAYRLLRRSVNNPAYRKLANRTDVHGKKGLFPDVNARLMASWARANFILLSNEDVKNVRVEPPKKKGGGVKSDAYRRWAARGGSHKYAHLWRHGD